MKIKHFLLPLPLLAAQVACNNAEQKNEENQKPNVVFIFADDLGWNDLGFQGSAFKTPNIDAMQKNGVYFSNAYANAPVSAPSRACLMSGLYAPRHKVYCVNKSYINPKYGLPLTTVPRNEDLDTSFTTLGNLFKQGGYKTGFIGKWHLRENKEECTPQNQGFDYVFGGDPNGMVKSHFPVYGLPSIKAQDSSTYLTDLLNQKAINFINESTQEPFFLFLSHYAVHDPIEAKTEDIEKFKETFNENDSNYFNPAYAAMVKSLDDGIGQIIQATKDKGIFENTIFIFFSDNGGSLAYTSNIPLRSGKGTLYEGGIRVPLIFYAPKFFKGKTVDIPVSSVDFMPTFNHLCKINSKITTDGNNLQALLKNDISRDFPVEREIFWAYPAQKKFKTRHKPKYRYQKTCFPTAVVRKGDFKYIYYYGLKDGELFNLKNDISETHNLQAELPEKAKEMEQNLLQWMKSTNAFMPQKNPEFDKQKSIEEGFSEL